MNCNFRINDYGQFFKDFYEKVPVPEVGPNDVKIKIHKTAICGTDVHIYQWNDWAQHTIPIGRVAFPKGSKIAYISSGMLGLQGHTLEAGITRYSAKAPFLFTPTPLASRQFSLCPSRQLRHFPQVIWPSPDTRSPIWKIITFKLYQYRTEVPDYGGVTMSNSMMWALVKEKPEEEHRASARCGKPDENRLITELNVCVRPVFHAL